MTVTTKVTNSTEAVDWQKMVAIEYREWLKDGGAKKHKSLRVAAFDRIADKWAREWAV
jgi:hypothetical protein